MKKITEFVKEVLGEAKHITWPTRKQAVFATIAVLVISVLIAYYLGLLDYLFGKGLKLLISR